MQSGILSSMRAYEFDRFIFDPADGRLARRTGSAEVHLRPQAGTLLARLLVQPRTVVGRDALVREIWGDETVVDFESGLAALLREVRKAVQSLGGDPALIETVPRRGYRLRADVRQIDSDDLDAAPVADRRNAKASILSPISASVAASVIVLALLLVAVAWWRAQPATDDESGRGHQLAILPLERFGNPDYPPAQAGILVADGILAALWRAELEHLELIGRAGMRPYAGREDVVSAVAADLGVDLLMEGSIRFAADRWQIDLRLLQVPPGRVVWSHTLEGGEPALPTGAAAEALVDRLADAWPELRRQLNHR